MLYFLGFFSGFAAILYQILWMRSLGLIFGSAAVSIGICLAAFMAGLGLGSFRMGRSADRSARPERLYAWLEMGIGAYGLLSPLIFSAGSALFHFLYDLCENRPPLLLWTRAACSFGLLFIPTFLMGGTFPAAVRYLARSTENRGRALGLFYAANTLGAAAAAFALPLFLLERLGMTGSTFFSVFCNVLAGTAAFFLPRLPATEFQPVMKDKRRKTNDKPDTPPYYIGAALFLSGLAALSLETLYNRILVMSFGSSIYSFSFILGVFLLGIGMGGHIFSVVEKRFRAENIFLFAQAMVFAALLIGLPFMDRLCFAQLKIFDMLDGQFLAFHLANILVAAAVAGMPAVGFGIGYPAALKCLTGDLPDFGSRTGFWAAINGAGATLGSLLVTFVWLPSLGSYRCFTLTLVLIGISMVLVSLSIKPVRAAIFGAATVVILIGHLNFSRSWNLRYFHTQIAIEPGWALQIWRQGEFEKFVDGINVKSFKEGRDGTVSVVEFLPGTRSLFVNGKIDASDNAPDMMTQGLLAHLPMEFHPNPKTALVVGLGSGVTAGAAAAYPLERLDVVEVSSEVVEAGRKYYTHVNRNVLEDTRVRMFVEDGRNFLAMRKFRYDIIINEPSNAWLSGASNLFTRDYYRLLNERLAEGGILCQWFQIYGMSWENLMSLLATLHSVFPHFYVFNYSDFTLGGDLMILASQSPLKVSPKLLAGLDPRLTSNPYLAKIQTANDLLKGYLLGSDEAAPLLAGRPLHTDERPLLELRGPKDLFLHGAFSIRFQMVENAPEVMMASDIRPFGPDIIPTAELRNMEPKESGIRAVSFFDDTRSYLRRATFKYMRWETADGTHIELLSPLLGLIPQPAHRLTLEAMARGTQLQDLPATVDGRPATLLKSADTESVRLYAAWNCPESQKTFYLRGRFPLSAAESSDPASRLMNLFGCSK